MIHGNRTGMYGVGITLRTSRVNVRVEKPDCVARAPARTRSIIDSDSGKLCASIWSRFAEAINATQTLITALATELLVECDFRSGRIAITIFR